MARDQRLNVDITATDRASAEITDVARKTEALDGTEATVEVDAETSSAETRLRQLATRIQGLSADDQIVVLRAASDEAQREVRKLTQQLAAAKDLGDDEIRVLVNQRGDAATRLAAIQSEIRRIDSARPEVEVEVDTSSAQEGIAGIGDALDALGVPVGNFAGKLGGLASPGGAIAAIAAGIILAADAAADMAINAENLATLTGDSVEYASRLNTVWSQTGADTKDLQDVLLQMNGVLATNRDLAAELGINLNDGATVGQRFEEVAAALDLIPDAARRSQIASQVFGEEGVRQYNALKNSVGDLSDALEAVPEGMVVSAEDVERARETKRAMAELKVELQAFATSIGTAVIPAINGVVTGLNDLFEGAEETGRGLRRFFDSTADENWAVVDEFDAANQAAADFDRTLLDGLTTFADVRAKVLELTDSEHAANVVALEWNETQKEQAKTHEELIAAYYRGIYATEQSTDATEDEEGAARNLTDEYNDQRNAIDDLIGRKTRLVGGDIAVREAQRTAKEKADELNEALATQSLTLEEIAPIIDEAAGAQLDAAQAAADRRAAELEANGTLVDSKTRNQLLKEELQRLADQTNGPLRAAIQGYIDDLNRIPTSVNTNITQNGTTDIRYGRQGVGPAGTPLGGNKDTGVIVSAQGFGGGSSSGSGVTLNVYAGIGTDGRQVGRQIVEALEAFFRSGGQLPPTMAQRLGG